MVATELGACEWFVWDLRRSNLIDRGQLDQVVGEFMQANPRAEPPGLADYLVANGIISQFQAERLLQGKTQGFVMGPFTLRDALGVGSMGTVYKAVSKTDNNWYAVKVLPRRSMWNVRIARRKVRAFEAVQHPSVVPFVDVGTAGGMHYLAWPFVEGATLDKVVQRDGPLPAERAARYAFLMAEALEACHHHGLFHGLFKPSNAMITPEDNIFLLDLGIGSLLAETEGESLVDTMSTANSVASGLDCASPESIMDPTNLSPAGDQYSLGCSLYYCLTGQFPFPEGTAAEKMMAHQFKEPVPIHELNPDVPKPLVDIVERLMQKVPDKRFATTAEVVEALRPMVEKREAHDRPAPAPTQRWSPSVSSPTVETPPMGGLPRPALHAAPAAASQPAPTPPKSKPGTGSAPRRAAPTMANIPRPRLQPPEVRTSGLPGALPSRQSLRDMPGAQVHHEEPEAPAADPNVEREIPGGYTERPRRSWDERLGTIGIAVGAVVAAVVAWLIASQFIS